ncbi:MAG: SufD family Fe-S cluster assembly protein [Pseudomonadota bacterium]
MDNPKTQEDATEVRGTLTNQERDLLNEVGFDSESSRAATSVLTDHEVRLAVSNDPGVEIMPLAVALRTYDFVQDLMFGLVDPNENEHIAMVAEHMHDPLGHFTWVKPGAKVKLPIQTFTMLETPQARQFTHDITLIEEGAEIEMIAGSAVPSSVHKGRHISVSETYQRPGSACKSVSIEHWGEAMEVYSYGHSRMEKGSSCTAVSIKLSPIRTHKSRSVSILEADANSVDQSILFAPVGTERVMDTETRLIGSGARSEDMARMVSAGGSIVNNALLIGEAADTNGFLGCDGLKLSDTGEVLAVPSLLARAEGAQLSHEASIGMIDSDKLNYLMATGMDEDAARDLIVQGFLALENDNVPAALRRRVSDLIAKAKSGGM